MKISNSYIYRKIAPLVILSFFIFAQMSQVCFSLPDPNQVVSGTVTFSNPDATTLTINASDGSIVNYNSFNIAPNESVIINLPNVNSDILNRVLGDQASQILGRLTSNGIVVLINQNGIFFGPNSNVDVAGLIASTRDITNSNFLNSNYLFEKLSKEQLDSLLLNQGTINIKEGGFGVLIAGAVKNEGTIIAPIGTVALAAGDMVKLDISGDGLISVAIDKETASTIFDTEGNPITSQIENTGTIKADGGTVLLKAESLPGIFETAINLEGQIQANDVAEKDGVIKIVSSGDTIIKGATLSAGSMEIGDPEGVGKVILAGPQPTYFYGDTTFYNFTSTDFGKEIYFGAGDTYTFKGDTYIRGGGGYDGLTKLFSTQEGSYWYGDFSEADNFDISYVALKDAYNLGDTITLNIGTNWGNSFNWTTYHDYDGGAANGNLSLAANYVELSIPAAGDFIRFPLVILGAITDAIADPAFQGTITNLIFVAGTPASLTLQRTITVTGDYTQAGGTLNLNGQTLQVNGTFTKTGGTINLGSGGKVVDSSGTTIIYPVPATTTITVSDENTAENTKAVDNLISLSDIFITLAEATEFEEQNVSIPKEEKVVQAEKAATPTALSISDIHVNNAMSIPVDAVKTLKLYGDICNYMGSYPANRSFATKVTNVGASGDVDVKNRDLEGKIILAKWIIVAPGKSEAVKYTTPPAAANKDETGELIKGAFDKLKPESDGEKTAQEERTQVQKDIDNANQTTTAGSPTTVTSASAVDLTNVKLYADGEALTSLPPTTSSDGKTVTFDLSSSPVKVSAGTSKTLDLRVAVGTTVGALTVNLGTTVSTSPQPIINGNNVKFAEIKLTAGASEAVKVTSVTVQRSGTQTTGDLTNVQLYDGNTLIATSPPAVSADGKNITFDLSSSPFNVAEGISKTVNVRADVLQGAGKTALSVKEARSTPATPTKDAANVEILRFNVKAEPNEEIKVNSVTFTAPTKGKDKL